METPNFEMPNYLVKKTASVNFKDNEAQSLVPVYAHASENGRNPMSFKSFVLRMAGIYRTHAMNLPAPGVPVEEFDNLKEANKTQNAIILNLQQQIKALNQGKDSNHMPAPKPAPAPEAPQAVENSNPDIRELVENMTPYYIVARETSGGRIKTYSDLFAQMLKLCQERGAFRMSEKDLNILKNHGL